MTLIFADRIAGDRYNMSYSDSRGHDPEVTSAYIETVARKIGARVAVSSSCGLPAEGIDDTLLAGYRQVSEFTERPSEDLRAASATWDHFERAGPIARLQLIGTEWLAERPDGSLATAWRSDIFRS